MHIRPFQEPDRAALIALWETCALVVPHNDSDKDIDRKVAQSPDWFLVGEVDGEIVASCMVGYDGHRGWINYLGVHPDHQRRGVGAQIMAEAERLLCAAGCPKINLQVRTSNLEAIAFYQRIGFVEDAVVGLGKRLEED